MQVAPVCASMIGNMCLFGVVATGCVYVHAFASAVF